MTKLVTFEDLAEGAVFYGDEVVADMDDMLHYARPYDPWPFHVDAEAAKESPFGGLVASSCPSVWQTEAPNRVTHVPGLFCYLSPRPFSFESSFHESFDSLSLAAAHPPAECHQANSEHE